MPNTFREIVGEAIGEASMCWAPPPTGEFDSTRASALIDRIDKAHLAQFTPDMGHEKTFEEQLRSLLNTWSKESTSNTPDFVLCQFMARSLDAFDSAVNARDHWYGFKPFDANAPTNTPRATFADIGGTEPR
jgi:hypothetical protein